MYSLVWTSIGDLERWPQTCRGCRFGLRCRIVQFDKDGGRGNSVTRYWPQITHELHIEANGANLDAT